MSGLKSKKKIRYPQRYISTILQVQTVNKNQNENFYNLIKEFYKLTNVPVILNTLMMLVNH